MLRLSFSLHSLRRYTTFSTKDIDRSRKWIEQFSSTQIPSKHFEITFSRSSGPGGQKVNKTSSKATVAMENDKWLNPQWCYWIPEPIRAQLREKKVRYETKTGGILIQCDTSRNRDTNVSECFERLTEEIKRVAYFEPEVTEENKKKWEELKEVSKEKRLFNKKKVSDKKKLRSKKFDF